MKLSTRARYGTRALLDLAMHSDQEPVPLKDISRRQDISLHYLEHIIAPLVAAGIVKSLRGVQGGISLARPPQEIRLSEVVDLLEGSISPVECIQSPNVCNRSGYCATRDIWAELAEAMNGVLDATTLADLVERQRRKDPAAAMYNI
jgi:Rrf2 family protein